MRSAFQNGALMTPDNKTFLVADSTSYNLVLFNIRDDCSLTNCCVRAELGNAVIPDGTWFYTKGIEWMTNTTGDILVRDWERIVTF